MMLRLLCKFHYAIHVAWVAAFNFNLNSAVADTVFRLQSFRDNSQYILTFTNSLLFDGDVTTASDDAGTNGLNMQIVNGDDAIDCGNCLFNRFNCHTFSRDDLMFAEFALASRPSGVIPPQIIHSGPHLLSPQ